MNANLQNAREIFIAAVKMAPDQWDAYLDEACQGDDSLRSRVADLLRAHDDIDSFLEPAAAGLVTTTEEPILEGPGTVIGPYKLLQQIGQGGMGAVFMAEQTQPVQRKVALKVIKPGMDSRQVIARFEAERQALAMMDHQNIAKVLEAGTTETGRLYFVMELVKGVPITEYCDDNNLTTRERLELFIPVCQAVQHAHQKGVIHRDLKPSNVLIARYDDKPVPKVIDFGVAKATGPKLTERTMFTQYGQIVGTLEYMSPEQAAFNALDIDTRSDIYALGVLLYELLTGSTPFEKKRLHEAAFDEMLRIIREEEPPKPSTRLSTLGQAATAVSAHRKTDPKRLSQLFRGELDWIVMKSLEKDRARRYETASSFGADVQRYLHDEPVQACPPSSWYRFRKFSRRHKAALVTAGLLTAALLTVAVIASVAAVWLHDERNATRDQLNLTQAAEGEARQAEQAATKSEWQGRQQLYEAKLAQAKASRWSGRVGQRFDALAALREAAQLLPVLKLETDQEARMVLELRNEAIAALTMVDLQNDREWDTAAGWDQGGIAFDGNLERYARCDGRGNIIVRRMADNVETARLSKQDLGIVEDIPAGYLIFVLRLSADGRFLAMKGRPDVALNQLWDLQGVQGPRLVLKTPAIGSGWYYKDLDFSPDGQRWAVYQPDGWVGVYETVSGKEVTRLKPGAVPSCLSFHPEGHQLGLYTPSSSTIRIMDMKSGRMIRQIGHPSRPAADIRWNSEGQLLASPIGHEIHIWDAQTGRLQAVCKGHQGTVLVATFSHDGDLLASTGWDGTTRLWDPWTGKQLLVADGACSHFSRDDRWLGFGSIGSKVGRWQVASRREPREFRRHAEGLTRLSTDVSPDGRLLATTAGHDASGAGVLFRDIASGKMVGAMEIGPVQVAFHPDGHSLLTTSYSQGVYRWPLQVDEKRAATHLRVGPPQALKAMTANRSAYSILSHDGSALLVICADKRSDQALVLDPQGKRDDVRVVSLDEPQVELAAISSNAQWAATSAWQGTDLKLWDAQTGERLQTFPGARQRPLFSPDNRWFVIATPEKYIFHDAGTWKPSHEIARSLAGVSPGEMAFSRDGKQFVMAHTRHVAKLFDPTTGKEWATLARPSADNLQALRFSPDGSRLVASYDRGLVTIWDLRRIRTQLRDLGLDWDAPPDPIAANPVAPLRLEVLLGELAKPAGPLAIDPTEKLQRELKKLTAQLAQKPGEADAYCRRGRIYYELDELDKAIADFRKTLELEPDYAYACIQLAWIHTMGPEKYRDPAQVLPLAEKGMQLKPRSHPYVKMLGIVYCRLGRSQQAVDLISRAIELRKPDHLVSDHLALALAYHQNGQPKEARTAYDEALWQWRTLESPSPLLIRELALARAEIELLLGLKERDD